MVRVHDVRLPATGGSYAVQVGTDLTGTLVDRLRTTDAWRRVAIVADETVASLHGGRLREALRATGRPVELVTFAAGEASKTRQTKEQLEDRLFGAGLGRDSVLVALGGGVTIDLAGFVAATYMRGLPFVAIPTSVLAMLDSSIGGKTGVDVPAGKNLVGAFHRPDLVLCDLLYLDTLPDVDLRHGMAEAIKHALIRSAPHLQDLETSADAVLARNRP
ncbi:MAG: 3-dehydroquinate synthase family protein, partial [Acidobacteriota bacterium]